MWLKDAVLCLFLDTRDCSPSLANFFGGPKRVLKGRKQNLGASKPVSSFGHRSPSVGRSSELEASGDQHRINSAHLGKAVKQLAPINLHNQLIMEKSSCCSPSVQLKRNIGLHQTKIWENWSLTGDLAGKVSYVFLLGCFIFGTFKLFSMRFGTYRIISRQWLSDPAKTSRDFAGRSIFSSIEKLSVMFRQNLRSGTISDNDPSSLTTSSAISGILPGTRQMPMEEAEALVKRWQQIKAEALGPDHQVQTLPEILEGSMLSKWQDLANSARGRSCFWRFVLLQLSILRAATGLDADGNELAEIEAVLEEAAELVDVSQPRKPSYYSKYKVQYILRRHDDGSWRFCGGGIQELV